MTPHTIYGRSGRDGRGGRAGPGIGQATPYTIYGKWMGGDAAVIPLYDLWEIAYARRPSA